MKIPVLVALIVLVSGTIHAQEKEQENRFGVVLLGNTDGELSPIVTSLGASFLHGKSQFELGIGLNLVGRPYQKIINSEVNYKYFPNGIQKRFNLYLIAQFRFRYDQRETYYQSKYNHLSLTGGYGFEITDAGGTYFGTNMGIGARTFVHRSENPYPHPGFYKAHYFQQLRTYLSLQICIGYRF